MVNEDAIVILEYWGSWWTTHGKAAKDELQNLFDGLGNSSWAATLHQYCANGNSPAWSSNLLVKTYSDTANPPSAAPTESQLREEINKISEKEGIQQYGGIYVLVTPPGTVPAWDTAHSACGHHSWLVIQQTGSENAWIDIPYGLIRSSNGCGWNLSNGVAGALSVVAGHEWAEAVTDPYVNSPSSIGGSAWATGSHGQEVADICEPGKLLQIFNNNLFTLHLKAGSFTMQKIWSNAAGQCVT
jgi:hypothetical protein